MTLDPKEAAASLDDIASVERRTRETLFYAGSSSILILWGVLSVIGNLVTWLAPRWATTAWVAIDVAGAAASFAILWWQLPADRRRETALRWAATYIALFGFGAAVMAEFWPVAPRQLDAFWPTLVYFGYVLAGIWIGRFFLYVGVGAIALILIGFFWLGPWFLPWMAVVLGGGLVAGGLWLRRSA